MFKTLTLTTLIGAGMLGAETMQPEISVLQYNQNCTEGKIGIRLQVTGALLGGEDNTYGRGEIHSKTLDGKKIPWEFNMTSFGLIGTEVDYLIKAPAQDFPEGASITLGGHLDLDVFDEIIYSAPVEVDFNELAARKGGFCIDGHQLALREERFVEDGDPVYHLGHDGDKTLIALEISGKEGEPDICPFLEVGDEDWNEADEDAGADVDDEEREAADEDARGDANLAVELPDYCAEGPVRVRAVYGKGLHTTQLPVDITVDTSYGVWAEFPEGVEVTHCDSRTRLYGTQYLTVSQYSIHAPEGLRFRKHGRWINNGQKLYVEVEACSPTQKKPSPGLTDVEITAIWDSGTAGVIDENVTFPLPFCKAVGEPLEVTVQDSAPKEISFAGHTYTAAITLEEDDRVYLLIGTAEKSEDVEIRVNGKPVREKYNGTEDADGRYDCVFAGYYIWLQKSDAPYTITFTRLEDAGSITLPVHIKGKTGMPFKNPVNPTNSDL